MTLRALEHWSDFACAGGYGQQDLSHVLECEESLRVDGNDALRVTVPQLYVRRRGFKLRQVLRLTDALGDIREYRVRRVERDPMGSTATIYGAPVLYDLAAAGLVRGPDGSTVLSASLTPAQWIDTYVLANLAADALPWLTRGTLHFTAYVTLALENVTRLGLLRALAEKVGGELQLRRTGEGAYAIDLLTEIGSTVTRAEAHYGRNLLSAVLEEDDGNLATIIQPSNTKPNANAAPVSMLQMAWRITGVAGTGPYALTLADPTGAPGPIYVDGQLDGYWLVAKDDTKIEILSSTASAQEVTVASLGTLALGMQVGLVRSSAGAVIEEVANDAALALYGRVVAPLAVGTARGERNLVTDGNFAYGGLTYLGTQATGWREVYPLAENAEISGAVTSNTSASTALPVSGFPANAVIRRGEQIIVGTLVLGASNAAVLPSSSSTSSATTASADNATVSIPLAGTLPTSLTDGQTIKLTATDYPNNASGTQVTNVTVNGAHSAGATSVSLRNVRGTRNLFNGDKLVVKRGGTYVGITDQPVAFINASPSPTTITASVSLTYLGWNGGNTGKPDPIPSGATVAMSHGPSGFTSTASLIGGQNMSGTTFTMSMILLPFSAVVVPAGTLCTFVSESAPVTITNTAADGTWPTNRQLAMSCASFAGLVIDGTTYGLPAGATAEWQTSAAASIAAGSIKFPSGLAISATGATVEVVEEFGGGRAADIPAGATLSIIGATNKVASTVTLDGTGAGTVTLVNAISAVATQGVSVTRRSSWPTVAGGVSMIRTQSGSCRADTPVRITVPSGTVNLLAKTRVHVWVPGGTASNAYTVVLYIIRNTGSAIVATATVNLANGVEFQTIELAAAFAATATDDYYITVVTNAPDSVAPNYYSMIESFGFYRDTADNTIPFTPGSFANTLWHAANTELTNRTLAPRTIKATVADLCRLTGIAVESLVLVKGGRIAFEALDVSSRMVDLVLNHTDPAQSAITLDTMPPRMSALV